MPFKFTPFPIKFSITPPSLAEKAKEALRQYFLNHFVPKSLYGERLIRSDGTVYLSQISEIISSVDGEERHFIEAPLNQISGEEGVYFVIS